MTTATTAAIANRTPDTDLPIGTCHAGLLVPGDIARAPGGWAEVTSIRLAPDHAAVVIVTFDGDPKPRRFHCDEPARYIIQEV